MQQRETVRDVGIKPCFDPGLLIATWTTCLLTLTLDVFASVK